MNKFKNDYSLEKRQKISLTAIDKYPQKIPIIVQNAEKSSLPQTEKIKYLVPRDMTVGLFLQAVRKKIKLNSDQSIFMFINNTLPTISHLMGDIYDQYHDPDDFFLYVILSEESTFG